MLFSFQPQVFSPIITADGYFSFAAQFLIAIGLAMELPLVVVILTALGLVTPQFLARDRKSTRLNSSHTVISYAVFCLKKKKQKSRTCRTQPPLTDQTYTSSRHAN